MEEKIIISSKQDKKALKCPLIIGLTLLLVGVIFIGIAVKYDGIYWANGAWNQIGRLLVGMSVICIIYYMATRSCELVVTDSRVYGKKIFGTQVDIPLDSISAVGLSTFCSQIVVSSSSGRISFLFIENRVDMHREISSLLRNRQTTIKDNEQQLPKESPANEVEKLKQYKELLDAGVINQEEFDAKKKQLLGL